MIRLKGQIPLIRRQGVVGLVGDEPISPNFTPTDSNYYYKPGATWDGNTDGLTYDESYGLYQLSDTRYIAGQLHGAKIGLSNGKTYIIPDNGGRFGEYGEMTLSILPYNGKNSILAYIKTIDGEPILAIKAINSLFGNLMVGITKTGVYLKSISFLEEIVWETLFEGDLTFTPITGGKPPKSYNYYKCIDEDGIGEDYGEDQTYPYFIQECIGEFPRSIMYRNVRLTVDKKSISGVPSNAKVKYKGNIEGAVIGYNPFYLLDNYIYLNGYPMIRTFPKNSGIEFYTDIIGTQRVKLEAQVYDTPLLVGCNIGDFVMPEFPEWNKAEHQYAFAVAAESSTSESYVIYLVATKEARHITVSTTTSTRELRFNKITPALTGESVGDCLAWRAMASYCEWVGQGREQSIAGAAVSDASLEFPIHDLPFAEGYDQYYTFYKVIWSNYDILDPDGNVYFAKSADPELVYE